jgi:hypothetical protein
MRTDTDTKAVLTVIAVLPATIASRPYFSPDAVVRAQGPFAGIQFSDSNTMAFFDPRTGEIWEYRSSGELYVKYRLTKLGQNLVKVK